MDVDRADDAGFEGLDHLDAAAWDNLALSGGDDVVGSLAGGIGRGGARAALRDHDEPVAGQRVAASRGGPVASREVIRAVSPVA